MIAKNVIHSIRLLGEGSRNFAIKCVDGMRLNLEKIKYYSD